MTTLIIPAYGNTYSLTTDHAAASSSEPVLVGLDGNTYRRGDIVLSGENPGPTGLEIHQWEVTAGAIVSDWQQAEFARTRVDPDIDGIIRQFLRLKSTPYWMTEDWLDQTSPRQKRHDA